MSLDLIKEVYSNRRKNCFINGDCLEILPNLPATSIDTILTQPPSFDQFSYTSDNGAIGYGQSYEDYMGDIYLVIEEFGRILKKHGNIFLAFSDFRKHGRLISIADDICNYVRIRKKIDLVERIILYIPNKAYVSNPKYFANKFTWVLHLSKDTNFFRKPHEMYNVMVHEVEEDMLMPDPFPYDFLTRIMMAYSDRDHLLLDPFCGTGRALRIATSFDIRSIGIEISKDYYEKYMPIFTGGEYVKV